MQRLTFREQTDMIGNLVEIKPWFLERSDEGNLKRLGDLLTFEVENRAPLHVQYLYPRNTPPVRLSLSTRFVIEDIKAPPMEPNPGYWFDAEGSRVLDIHRLR
jgi:hypothetical protein